MVPLGSTKEINGHVFTGWGAHARNYRCAYLTAAAAIGMSKADVDTFLKRLDKCLSKFTSTTVSRSVGHDDGQQEENGKDDVSGDLETTDNLTVNR